MFFCCCCFYSFQVTRFYDITPFWILQRANQRSSRHTSFQRAMRMWTGWVELTTTTKNPDTRSRSPRSDIKCIWFRSFGGKHLKCVIICFNGPCPWTLGHSWLLAAVCFSLWTRALKEGQSVAVDNTNPDPESRKSYLSLIKKKKKYSIFVFVTKTAPSIIFSTDI